MSVTDDEQVTDEQARMEKPKSWDEVREWRDLQTTGLLWLINTTVFHPRGFALGLVPGEGDDGTGPYFGWVIQGDGSEPWVMPADDVTDERFHAVQEFFAEIAAARSAQ